MEKSEKLKSYTASLVGFIEEMFGSLSKYVVFNQKKEKIKLWLDKVYWFGSRVYEIIPKELDDESLQKRLNTIFSYNYSHEILENEKVKKGFFNK